MVALAGTGLADTPIRTPSPVFFAEVSNPFPVMDPCPLLLFAIKQTGPSTENVPTGLATLQGLETNVTWYGTAVVDEEGVLGGAADEINALRMRTQEQFPNFGEVDDLANFEEIQRGLACLEDEWIYMHRGLGIPDRVKTDANGIITAPATDEAFMREYIKEWKRLMQASPKLAVRREP